MEPDSAPGVALRRATYATMTGCIEAVFFFE